MSAPRTYIRKYGLFGLLPLVVRWVGRVLSRSRPSWVDLEYGVETDKVVPMEELEVTSVRAAFGHRYEGTNEAVFRRIVSNLPIDASDYMFIDFGCGKGRALILAALEGFGRVVGVEFSDELCVIARRNVARFKELSGSNADISVICADATEFELPFMPSVIYLFNPFGEPIVDAVCRRIVQSLLSSPRDIFVAYENPQWRRTTFDRCQAMHVHRSALWTSDWFVVYRSSERDGVVARDS